MSYDHNEGDPILAMLGAIAMVIACTIGIGVCIALVVWGIGPA